MTSNLARTLKIYPKVFEKSEFQELHSFFDKALFTVLNQLDLIIGLKYLDISQAVGNKLEANYFARVLILTSHEILNDLNKMVGKRVRNELFQNVGEDELKELDEGTKEMNNLRKRHLDKLKNLRNKVLGHKLEHANQQAEIMKSINLMDIYDIGNSIYKVQMRFISAYSNLLNKL